jgi:hypothetical protein
MSRELESGRLSENAILHDEAIFRRIRFDINGLAGVRNAAGSRMSVSSVIIRFSPFFHTHFYISFRRTSTSLFRRTWVNSPFSTRVDHMEIEL